MSDVCKCRACTEHRQRIAKDEIVEAARKVIEVGDRGPWGNAFADALQELSEALKTLDGDG